MDLVYPGIIIITDSYPCQNGAGISQTLFNLFSGYPGKLFVYKNADEPMPEGNRLKAQTISYQLPAPSLLSNRLGRLLNTTIEKVRYYRLQHHFTPIGLPDPQQHLVLVSTTTSEKLVLAQVLSKKYHYTVIPYFMDDWLCNNTIQWRGGSLQQVAADLLRKAPARLMISSHLQKILEQRYQLPFAPTLIVHNPSPLPTQTHTKFPPKGGLGGQTHTSFPLSGETGTHTPTIPVNLSTNQPVNLITYAGSIWPMHADALIAVAKAIQLLNASGKKDFSLCIYTSQGHWEKYKSMLQGEGVHWGGWLPYDEVRKKFSDAFLLLCTASFEKAQQAFTNSSVQTKLTDYIAAGRPVLVVAPTGAASGEWVINETCGYWLQTQEPVQIATQLLYLAKQPLDWQKKAERASLMASTNYSAAAVQQRLYQFLNTHG